MEPEPEFTDDDVAGHSNRTTDDAGVERCAAGRGAGRGGGAHAMVEVPLLHAIVGEPLLSGVSQRVSLAVVSVIARVSSRHAAGHKT